MSGSEMEFRIADTFTASLGRLAGDEQKAVNITAFELQMDPAQPGMRFHRIDSAKDRNFWSVRVSRDLRLIVHKSGANLLLCYVDHHDAAYRWAERRRLEKHPRTGAAQIVEIREKVLEIEVPRYIEVETIASEIAEDTRRIFVDIPEDELLGYGVPVEWMDDVKQATQESLLDLSDHLPAEAAEALLDLATGGSPTRPMVYTSKSLAPDLRPRAHESDRTVDSRPSLSAAEHANPFAHPDAQRRFRVMANAEELRQALDHPWEKWIVFLHPAQRQVVERDYNGPARVAGSAGTGKTVVALHRVVHLARTHRDARILLATFSEALAAVLQVRLTRLISNEPRLAERLEVHSMSGIARRLYEANLGTPKLITADEVRELLDRAASEVEGHRFSSTFVWTEWSKVVDAWQLETWEDYRDVARLGRKTRLAEKQRAVLWSIFLKVREALAQRELLTECGMFRRLERHLFKARHTPFEHCVIDEAQDVGVAELRLLSVLGGDRPNSLFFAGDLGQRIFQTPFSWRSLGVDVRGRSQILRVNYRTSHQIRRQADRLLPSALADVDGVTEQRGGTISAFNGPEPLVRVLVSAEEELACVAEWLRARQNEGYEPHEIGVFVRSDAELERAIKSIEDAGLSAVNLSTHPGGVSGSVAAGTMHLAKGLEFRAVVVAACDDEVLPLQSRIETIADEADLEEVYNTERHLLYVACTRARDRLLVTGVDPASEFLDDLHMDG